MRISDICYLREFNLSSLFVPQTRKVPATPLYSAKKFIKMAKKLKPIPGMPGYTEGSIPASNFVNYDIENWQRNQDPRLKAVEKTISQGIREPIQLAQPGKDRVAVVDGGHRISAAVNYWLHTGKDVQIPFYFHSRKLK